MLKEPLDVWKSSLHLDNNSCVEMQEGLAARTRRTLTRSALSAWFVKVCRLTSAENVSSSYLLHGEQHHRLTTLQAVSGESVFMLT